MGYRIQAPSSLSSIATQALDDEARRAEIARINGFTTPDRLLVAPLLRLPAAARTIPSRAPRTRPTRWGPGQFPPRRSD
ncbi:hypothetical protein [Sphingomonas sp. CFBP 8760]|uniref:hypothetical protein n=1 Tax=Sphingomonas sp. CFBP 8760 TaxID=2775282 RepID=UPI00178692DF|nr:hypothetical protein [Sphingomonas sp. CFBP 8760]MBD8546022.1 hypothetical protein [Sphingomonas sp. CFBP 8760]